jgi:hypothetical protein
LFCIPWITPWVGSNGSLILTLSGIRQDDFSGCSSLLVMEQVIISHVVRPSIYLLLCSLEPSCCLCGMWSWQMNFMCLL